MPTTETGRLLVQGHGLHPHHRARRLRGPSSPRQEGRSHILFFQVPEPKIAKNRVYIDLAAKDPGEEIERLVALGATKVEFREGNGTSWTVMLDPEGNEFCVG